MATGTVEFTNVSYTLPSVQILTSVSLSLEANTVTALLGRSGSGKTTLLRMVNGLVRPTSGEVRVSGHPVENDHLIELRRATGYVIQEAGLFPHMTVERNVGMAMELAGRPPAEIKTRVSEVLVLAGIDAEQLSGRYPWQLSGGQRQRVGLARALLLDAPVLLLDEPFGALDPLTRAEMQTMLKNLLQAVQKTVLLVTHDLDEALYLAQRVVFLDSGKVIADLPSDEVLSSENPQVRAYVAVVHRSGPA